MTDARATVSQAVHRYGAAKVAKAMGISREALLGFCGGFRSHEATRVLIELRLPQLAHIERGELPASGITRGER